MEKRKWRKSETACNNKFRAWMSRAVEREFAKTEPNKERTELNGKLYDA